MARIALYRKYRPGDFSEVGGQESAMQTLQNAVKTGSFSHAYIFCGPRGIGKTSVARIMAKAVNCQHSDSRQRLTAEEIPASAGMTKVGGNDKKVGGNDKKGGGNDPDSLKLRGASKWDGNPCNKCDSCTSINNQTALDVIEIDAASNRGIDEIRELREKVKFTPSSLAFKVFIIDEVHMLTKEAFNALLKTLEEPPEHALFIMATTEIHKIPATVISRCQRFDFRKISKSDLVKGLTEIAKKEKIEADKEALELIASLSEGGFRDAISILDQISMNQKGLKITEKNVSELMGIVGRVEIDKLMGFIEKKQKKDALLLLEELIREKGSDIGQLTKAILESYREKLTEAIEKGEFGGNHVNAIEILNDCNKNFRFSLYPQLSLEVALLKIIGANDNPDEKMQEDNDSKSQKVVETNKISMPKKRGNIENWNQVLLQIKSKNNSIHAFVREAAEPVLFENEIHLTFPHKFHKERIEDRKNRIVVEEAIEKILGEKYRIICKTGKTGRAHTRESEISSKTEAKPAINALDILGGEVVG